MFSQDVRVVELAEASKAAALRQGNAEARHFPRLYVDADVELSTASARELRSALGVEGALAAAPERALTLREASLPVREYCAVWMRLPQVRDGLFGRGVIAVSAAGYERIQHLPLVLSDDLAVSEAFSPDERTIVAGATATIHPPRTLRDLVRRRTRVAVGNAQIDRDGGRSAAIRTSWSDLLEIGRAEPRVSLGLPVFVGVAAAAKLAAARQVQKGDFTTWSRDESSRRAASTYAAQASSTTSKPQPALDVLVIVVTYNSEDVVGGLLESLPQALDGLRWKLVVADNNSQDGTVEVVAARAPNAQIVNLGRNAGYAAGINAGLAAGPSSKSALVLNADARLAPGSVAAMFRRLRGPVGIVVPRLLGSTHKLADTLRREPNVRRSIGDTILGADRAGHFPMWGESVMDVASYERDTTADWAAAPAILVSRECLDACGPWDESFFLYSEETEFCLRARDLGYRLVLASDAEALHLGGESRVSPQLRTLLVVNRVRLYRRRHNLAATAAFWCIAVVRETTRLLLRRPASARALAALVIPGRAHRAAKDAASQLPDRMRRRALAQAASAASLKSAP